MVLRTNELGWRLHKHVGWYAIRRAHPPLCSRLWQVGPLFINLLVAAAIWLGRDRVIRYTLCASAVVLVGVSLFGTARAKRATWPAISGVAIFLGLLTGDRIGIDAALSTTPFSLLLGLCCFRPMVLFVDVRRHILGDLGYQVPFARLGVELNQDQESGRYQVYLKDAQPLWETSTHAGIWKCRAWESSTEAEASTIVGEFRTWGIGIPDPRTEVQVVEGDKRLRLLAYSGHIVAFIALIAFLARTLPGMGNKPIDAKPEAVLRAAQIIIASFFLSALPLAVYLCRLGRGAVRCRRLPPPGMRIVSDMHLIEGDKAVVRGRRMAAAGFVLIVMGLIGGLYAPYELGKTYGEQFRPTTPAVSSQK